MEHDSKLSHIKVSELMIVNKANAVREIKINRTLSQKQRLHHISALFGGGTRRWYDATDFNQKQNFC